MLKRLLQILPAIIICLVFVFSTNAQADASTSSGRPSAQDDYKPEGFYETLIRKQIEAEKKSYQKTIERIEEIERLSKTLQSSIESKSQLTPETANTIKSLDKTIDKVRDDLGAKSESAEESPQNLESAVNSLAEESGNLLTAIKNTSRFSISVKAIQASNKISKALAFIKKFYQ